MNPAVSEALHPSLIGFGNVKPALKRDAEGIGAALEETRGEHEALGQGPIDLLEVNAAIEASLSGERG